MSKSGRDLTADEKKLWRRVAAHVKTRKALPADPGPEERVPRLSAPKRERADPPAPTAVKGAAPPLADRGAEKKVRRGKIEIGATLDLHGHTQDSARSALGRFVRAAQRRGERTVIVVTGVGRSGQGVLKQRLPEWLAEADLRARVSGFAQAHRSHGGAGAYYIFLKRPAE